jgi:pSer/pThr/pTyr-binding forkhead associated (FHA) protein
MTTIGRSLDNDVVIQNEAVSRHHARVFYEESQFVLYDLGSTGGTFVNAQRSDREVLFSGDKIHLSSEELLFMLKGASINNTSEQETQFLTRQQSMPTENQEVPVQSEENAPIPTESNVPIPPEENVPISTETNAPYLPEADVPNPPETTESPPSETNELPPLETDIPYTPPFY